MSNTAWSGPSMSDPCIRTFAEKHPGKPVQKQRTGSPSPKICSFPCCSINIVGKYMFVASYFATLVRNSTSCLKMHISCCLTAAAVGTGSGRKWLALFLVRSLPNMTNSLRKGPMAASMIGCQKNLATYPKTWLAAKYFWLPPKKCDWVSRNPVTNPPRIWPGTNPTKFG